MAWLTPQELQTMGFKSFGKNVLISRLASFYGVEHITIGNNVRIDDFCVISAGKGGIDIGNYIHIAVYSSLIGAGHISLSDYCNISSRVSIYSSTDDFSGEYMTNPMIDANLTHVTSAPVSLEKHVLIGSGSVILPGTTLFQGVAVGALSLVKESLPEFTICAGQPAKIIKKRERELLTLEHKITNHG